MKRTKKPWVEVVKVGRIEVKIRRRPGYKGGWRYIVEDWSTGKRSQNTFDELEEAREDATRIANHISTGSVQAAQMNQDEAMEYIRARTVLKPFSLTVSGASELLVLSLTKLGDVHRLHEAVNFYSARYKKLIPKPVAAVLTDLITHRKSKKKSDRYLKDLQSRGGRFAKDFVTNIGEITTPQVQTWLDSMDFESQQTYKNYRTVLNTLFNFGFKRGHCHDNPIALVDPADLDSADEVAIYSPDEITKLLAACTPDFLPCMVIGAFAGLRSAEISRLDWADIDWTSKQFVLKKSVTKTKYRRTVPIHDNLMAWLTPFKGRTGKVWTGTYFGYYRTQSAIGEAAGVEWKHNALRHSYCSYRFSILADAGKVAGEMGNSKAMIDRHYRELVKPADAAAWFAVQPQQAANIVSLAVNE